MAFLEARDLVVEYATRRGPVRALDEASLEVAAGEVVGVVGESGSGKSTIGVALARLLPGNARVSSGDVLVGGRSVLAMGDEELRALRRDTLGFVFQDPIGTLDPTARIGRQLGWMIGGKPGDRELVEHLERVRLPDPERTLRAFPHQLSGGMAQRVSIALALARAPQAVIADEPTASLDASVRSEILELLVSLTREAGTALMLMSHDLRAVRRFCTRVAVVYGGRVVETAPAQELFSSPQHPYTRALLDAAPGAEAPGETLRPIAGIPPVLHGAFRGCAFVGRCACAVEACSVERPVVHSDDHDVLCHLAPVKEKAA
ncbi:ABC transporter ATP-binding protein [Conexibacter sp. JD483]|uniref:ABC transporter ATP-binding protein n=1 Tax=unclassified Conexibacter TaxID=2627773 RepID=UPI0027160D6B|nr:MULTISPECIES: ABC transporter ATP-binding protein [unclassified Conexibacter]MDO8186907.1 ABC transporter ATP-binding protein [Conexibacter sp. CPCC 205706]MDO8200781.1 ABC transporter ATP-binding protein [Conexibacter sp. CPCC 205762]MDR9371981.1 ABC transporter ATP-binding protein [Conexibacter sp. JD483]